MLLSESQFETATNKLPKHNQHTFSVKGADKFAITTQGDKFERLVAYGNFVNGQINVQWVLNGFQSFFK